jgi:hypothetical protein
VKRSVSVLVPMGSRVKVSWHWRCTYLIFNSTTPLKSLWHVAYRALSVACFGALHAVDPPVMKLIRGRQFRAAQ